MRVRTPTIIQMESIESGAAALGIILGYYGKFIPLEQLRIDCGISRDGSQLSHILAAAKKYGLDVQEKQVNIEELSTLKFPFLISWQKGHYVVVEGIGKKKAFLNDPASGPTLVTLDAFNAHFDGKAIVFIPTSQFQKEGQPKPLFQLILNRFRGCTKPIIFLFLTGLFLLIPGIALPTLTQFFVDEIYVRKLLGNAFLVIGGLILAGLLASFLTALQGYVLARLNGKLSIRLSSQFLWHILRLPVEFYVQRYGGEIAYRLTINDKIITVLTAELAHTFIHLILIIVYGTLMFFYDPMIAWIGIGAGILNLALLTAINRARTDANIRLQQDMGKRVGETIQGIQNIETLKASGSESDFFARWTGYFVKTINSVQEIGKLDIFLAIIPPFTQFLALSVVLVLGGMRVIDGRMSLGMLIALQTLMQIFLSPISSFIYLGQRIQNVKGGLYRLDDVLSNHTDPQLDLYLPESENSSKLRGEVSLKNVTFGYNVLGPPLIQDFSLEIKPGQSIGLVGPSGCGKSTIVRLILGLYKPWSGDILFDQKSFSSLNRSVFCRSVASVDQRIFLFSGSVRDNLTLWDDSIPEEDVTKAAMDAQIHSVLLQREHSYDSVVLEGGLNFSMGECQRLEIARALALNPSFIIFDEATSDLDANTEGAIIKKLRDRGCSSLIISHRFSTIRDCDQILILDKGRVVQMGTPESLKSFWYSHAG